MPSTSSSRQPLSRALALVVLVLLGAGIRFWFWQIYETQTAPDTGTYVEVAAQIGAMDFSGYMGRRTPMYPLLLAAAQLDHNAVWVAQSVLGVGISILIFLLVLEFVRSVPLALTVALFHSLTLNQLFYEANILTETLATFLVLASVLLVLRSLRDNGSIGLATLAGLCTAAATLTRPQFIYLGPLFGFALLVATWGSDKKRLLALVAAFLLPLAGWALFNKATVNYLGLTTQLGMSLAQHSGKFIDKAPDEFATLRDIYMKHRVQMPADADHMTIWEAVPDMLKETGLSFLDLNRQLTKLSVVLIANNPDVYLRSVLGAWYSFWPVPNTWNRDQIRGPGARRALELLWSVEHVLLRAMNLAFVVLALGLAARAVFRRFADRRENLYLLLAGVVLAGSVVQALLEATDNARYSIPTQPLVGIFVITLAFECVRSWQSRRTIERAKAVP